MYKNKEEASIAAQNVPCGAAVWIGQALAKFYGVDKQGWYVVALGKVKQ